MSFIKCALKYAFLSLVIFLIIAYTPLLLDVDPHPFSPPEVSPLNSIEPRNEMNILEKKFENVLKSPESFAYHEGVVYSGLGDGRIVAIEGNNVRNISVPSATCDGPWSSYKCGRPLGIRMGSDGHLYYMDPFIGMIKVDIKSGTKEVLVKAGFKVDGRPLKFLDDLFIDEKRDAIYFSDASSKWGINQMMYLIIENHPTGRVLKYDRKTKQVSTVADGFYFTNGIQMTHDGKNLLVTDSLRSTIYKIPLDGPNEGKLEIFIDKLPGNSDNIRPSKRGGYWVAMALVKFPNSCRPLDYLPKLPAIVRKVLMRIMHRVGVSIEFFSHHFFTSPTWKGLAFLASSHNYLNIFFVPNYGLILELDKDGKIIDSLHAPQGEVKLISEVLELDDGTLFLGSFANNYLGVIKRK